MRSNNLFIFWIFGTQLHDNDTHQYKGRIIRVVGLDRPYSARQLISSLGKVWSCRGRSIGHGWFVQCTERLIMHQASEKEAFFLLVGSKNQ